MEAPFDNPVWTALTTGQRALAQGDGRARRFPADVAPFVALADDTERAHADAAALVAPGETVCFLGRGPRGPWETLSSGLALQMAWRTRPDDVPRLPFAELGPADAADMVGLTAIAFPGFFRERTVELGRYVGVRVDGTLVAMAGERLRPGGACEVSGVCTHPGHVGRGYAAALSLEIARAIAARGEQAILHVGAGNARARTLYARLGFVVVAELEIRHLRRTGHPGEKRMTP
jgi:ribosomal protein S18 acetylase RimI-like enzyme